VVPPKAQDMMVDYDRVVQHFEVVDDAFEVRR
jgi:hypothetical protein